MQELIFRYLFKKKKKKKKKSGKKKGGGDDEACIIKRNQWTHKNLYSAVTNSFTFKGNSLFENLSLKMEHIHQGSLMTQILAATEGILQGNRSHSRVTLPMNFIAH